MRRILALIAGLLCLSAVSFAQAPVPSDVALTAAIADVNAKLGTAYTYNGGQLTYTFNEERVTGDNLGCAAVTATNQNAYVVMTTQFDFNFDNVFEWEHRFAYEADGSLKMVVCRQPDLSQPQPTQAPTLTETAAPEDPQVTPEGTPVNEEPIYGRDGPRIFPPLVCGELPTRLVNGSVGRVIPGGAVNNLRQTQDVTSLKIGELAGGATFTVMDGPFCNGDIAWYLVGDGTTPRGWTAEGVDGDYFLEPVYTDAQLIRPENVDQLAPFWGQLGPGASAISANAPGRLAAITNGDTVQVWKAISDFGPLGVMMWDVDMAIETPASWVFADNTGRVWIVGANNEITLQSPEGAQIGPVGTATTSEDGILPVAIDGESNFVAITIPNGVELHQIGRSGAQNELLFTLPVDGTVQDLAFSSDGMRLYVLTDEALTVYPYVMGEGWTGAASDVIAHDLAPGKLAVTDGGRVAIAGTSSASVPTIRVMDNLNNEISGDETTVDYLVPDSTVGLSAPSFNADGSLVAVYTTDDTVLLMDTTTGDVTTLETGADFNAPGQVAFSRDGLLLWVLSAEGGVQAYAVAAEAPAG